MIPPESSCPADIGFDCTNEELFKALERMMTGSERPSNVIVLNPFKDRPTNLQMGVWYLINSKENTDTECGFWKTEEEACEVFSNSAIIGWRTTLQYYNGQVPQECKTDWLMQVFSITQKTPCENRMVKEATLLCKVFLADEKSTDQNLRQKMSLTDTTTTKQNNLTEQLLQKGGSNTTVGSTSEPKENRDDEIRALLPVMERITDHHIENPPEADYIPIEDYLELRDLDDTASPSSSSENSSCLTMSSDACFDSLALLRDLDREMDQVLEQRNAGYTFTVSYNPTEVVMLPATSESVHVRSNLRTTEIPENDSPVPISAMESRDPDNKAGKNPIRNQKRYRQGEGSSSSSSPYNSSTPASSHIAITDGQKKGAMDRIKRLKKYLCFGLFMIILSHV